MAHELEIDETTGKANMVYVGSEVPWHSLGTQLDSNKIYTPAEILAEANLDWKVEKRDAYYKDDKGNFIRAPRKQALVRSTDGKYMDIVSDGWKPVQNEVAFEFFSDYIKAGGMTLHTAGSLKEGKIVWALAKINESFTVFNKDQIDSYLLLSNPHQFGFGVDVRFTPIRVVCANTLSLSLEGQTKLGISLNHRSDFNVEKVKEALKEAANKMKTYKEAAEFLGASKFTSKTVFEYFKQVFPKVSGVDTKVININDVKNRMKKEYSRNAETALEVLDTQPGAEYAKGSWYHAFNTVTYLTNHVLGHNDDTRVQSLWYGVNKDRNIRALALALSFAKAA